MQNAILLTLVLAILALLVINPFQLYMISMASMVTLSLFTLVVFGLLIFVWREKKEDERELAHNAFASRLGFIVGSATLLIVLLVQSVVATLDPWLVGALVAMLAGKIIGRAYIDEKN